MHNGVPLDYAMNEACSAGTGSFLEEAAAGDLNITDVTKIGDLALSSQRPLKFGEHCAAFINAEIRKAILQGASKEDITAGLVLSIVSNYLNRVVGNRTIGNHISMQGGVAKNPAVPLAVAYLLKKQVVVPPFPELLGCFGAALIAIKKHKEGLLEKVLVDLNAYLNKEFKIENTEIEPVKYIELRNKLKWTLLFKTGNENFETSLKLDKEELDIIDNELKTRYNTGCS